MAENVPRVLCLRFLGIPSPALLLDPGCSSSGTVPEGKHRSTPPYSVALSEKWSCSDCRCFSPVSPSCLREGLHLVWYLPESAISPFLLNLQFAPQCTDTDAEHPQPALPPCRAGGALPVELP